MFLYSGKEKDKETHNAVHVGIVAQVNEETIVTIEGNVGPVCWREYEYGKTNQSLGFARLPDNPNYRTIKGNPGCVTYSGVFPENAQLLIRPLSDEELEKYELPEGRLLFAFETSYLVDGTEQKHVGAVSVRIETGALPEGTVQVFHIREDDKGKIVEKWPVEQLEVTDDALSYTTFSLSRSIGILTPPDSGQDDPGEE